jgi:broad specificity phosphatase PhoE
MHWPWSGIWIARHGETEWNVEGRRQGRLDSPLTDRGIADAGQVADLARGWALDALWCSPIGRAEQTATLIGDSIGLQPVRIDGLAEIDHGAFAGLTNDEIEAAHPGALDVRAANKYAWRFPGGESYADADDRARLTLDTLAADDARRPLIVTHQMFARALLKNLLAIPADDALELSVEHGTVWHINPQLCTRTILTIDSQ